MRTERLKCRKKDIVVIEKNYDKCDKFDYLVSAFSGAVGGLVDIFVVGSPLHSKAGKMTDDAINKVVENFAKLNKWDGHGEIDGAIRFLEDKFKVNYDQAVNNVQEGIIGVTPALHHMQSMAHSPDIIGLFFSIVNQFTGTSTIAFQGKLIHFQVERQKLVGRNFVQKLLYGCVNWVGHLLSDIAGSSSAKRKGSRGAGIVAPFYEMFELLDVGEIDEDTIAKLAESVYKKGYDARFALTASIPCKISEFLTSFIWALREYFNGNKIKETIKKIRQDSRLRIMHIVSNATLCVMDAIDAALQSAGNIVTFFTRLNLVAWYKLILRVIKAIAINFGVDDMLNGFYEYVKSCMMEEIEKLKNAFTTKYAREIAIANAYIYNLELSKKAYEINELMIIGVSKVENGTKKFIECSLEKLPKSKKEAEEELRKQQELRDKQNKIRRIIVVSCISILIIGVVLFLVLGKTKM